jgi:hypothetical protein
MDASDHGPNGSGYSLETNGQFAQTRSEMQKVRDLLFGEQQRATEQRLLLIEQRFADFQRSVTGQLRDLTRRLDDIAATMPTQHRESMLALSRAVASLGQEIAHVALDGMQVPTANAPETE